MNKSDNLFINLSPALIGSEISVENHSRMTSFKSTLFILLAVFLRANIAFHSNFFHNYNYKPQHVNTALYDESGDNNDRSPEFQAKIKAEISSPFRLLRLFIYGGAGAAGALGTFTAIPQLLFAIQDGGDAVTPALTNIGIDLGAIIGAVLLFDKERSLEAIKVEKYTEREKRATGKLSSAEISEREAELALLPVEIQFSTSNENVTRIVSFADLQARGGQNVVVVAGSVSFVKDAVLAARIEGTELFNKNNVYIVPVVLNDEQLADSEAGSSKGFGKDSGKDSILSASYIGKPQQLSVWERYLQKEIRAAQQQGTKNIAKEGLVLAIDKRGRVVRRGLGTPPWKQLVEVVLAQSNK